MSLVVGIDEVGRGCWAGPLVAAAVVLRDDFSVPPGFSWKLQDSKLLTRQQRERSDIEIRKLAKAVGIGWVEARLIDERGLTAATHLAMQTALAQILIPYDTIIIDGNYNFLKENPKAMAQIGADNLVPAVSAASIIAKVARDAYMRDVGRIYAEYQFEKHVGYGTRLHRELLHFYGACELHRRSYKPVKAAIRAI